MSRRLKRLENKAVISKDKAEKPIIIYGIKKEDSYYIPESFVLKIGLDPTQFLNRTFLGNSDYKKVSRDLINESVLKKIGKYILIDFV
jgi:hypothetical protein